MLELLKKDLYVLMTYGRHMVPAEKGIRQYEEYIEILSRCLGVIRCQPYDASHMVKLPNMEWS